MIDENKKLHWKYYDHYKDTIILYQTLDSDYTYMDKIIFLCKQLWYVIIGSDYEINEIVIESKDELDQLKWFVGEMKDEDLLY